MCNKILSFVFLFIFIFTTNVFATEYTADGSGQTEKAAVQDSLRNALENVVGMIVDGRTYTNNLQVIKDQIYTQTNGYIRSYNVVNKKFDNGMWTVKTNVNVDTDENSDLMNKLEKLKTIKMLMNDPRIGVIIIDQNNNYQQNDNQNVESSIQNILNNSGFTHVMSIDQLKKIRNDKIYNAIVNDDINLLKESGKQEELDYIIVGTIKTNYLNTNFHTKQIQMYSSRSILNCKIIKCDTGEIIQSNQFAESGTDVTNESSKSASELQTGISAGNEIVNKLLNNSSKVSNNITLYVSNFKNDTDIKIVDEYLKNFQGIQNVYIRNYSNKMSTIDISYNGDAQTLVECFNSDQYFPGTINKFSSGTININMK